MKLETKVGLFVTLVLLFFFGLLTQLSSFDNLFKKSYPIKAEIADGSGLKDKAKVKFKGVDIGFVKSVSLEANRVVTHLMIDEGIKIPTDSIIVISQDSLLGGKFLDIRPGEAKSFLAPDMLLKREEKISSLGDASTSADNAFKEMTLVLKDLREILQQGGKEDLAKTLSNLREFTDLLASINQEENQTIHNIIQNTNKTLDEFNTMSQNISQTSDEYRIVANNINKKLPQIMDRIDSVALTLDKKLPSVLKKADSIAYTLDTKLPVAMDKFIALEDDLMGTVKENKTPLKNALVSVDKFFGSGADTLEKVDKYFDTAIKSELAVEMRTDQIMGDGGYAKTYVDLALKPDATRYYMIGATTGPDFSSNPSDPKGYIGNKDHDEGKMRISAQYGKRFDDILFRIGLIENQGGLGVDFFGYNDTLKLSTNLYDFNAVNDVRGTNPNLSATARYQFFKHVNAYVGANNVLNKDATNFSVGLGISFVDNDLKNLLGVAASASK